MMENIWQDLPKPYFMLAPMEAVTDVVFRHVVAKATRPDLFFTEFTNVSSFASPKGQASTRGRLEFTPDEQPIIAQIWGSKPADFAVTAKGLKQMGFKALDINTGCPDKQVVKSGGGSDLIRHPELTSEIIAAAKTAGLPVSVKTRLGYSKVDEWYDWLEFLLKQDIVALTIHLRTKKEMSKVPAHYELIPEIVKLRNKIAPNTLININGDIKSRAHGMELYNKYIKHDINIDGFMIGRGIFADPFCFEKVPKEHNREELLRLLDYHLDLFDQHQLRKFDPLKRFFKIYIRDFPGANELRTKLMDAKSTTEVRQILGDFRKDVKI
ncbi:tRNA-dihydrouridine synthase [Candidatus Saccharibacteria bacterium]|nr:tRNA-dihydrouridine synthase [Candidatus Saccharibacteria bacterium]